MTSETLRNLAGEPCKVKKVGKITVNGEEVGARDESSLPWVDGLRVLSFLLVAWYGLSYVVSGGESWTWGVQPDFMKTEWWMAKIRGPLYLTPDELMAYDGRDADKPLYLSVNGTIYDVSPGRNMYGPGGHYQAFAGHDNSRAFITSCLENDNVPDVRGAEAAFLPLDDIEIDAHWTTAEMAAMRERELAAAKEKAHAALKNWVDFFAKSPKYRMVGYLKWDPEELKGKPLLPLCEKAQQSRNKRDLGDRQS
ncbi:Cytochrome b5 [Ophiocordyceps camponoti-floridani]|uniref:Cytochrome b5 n=1 Tax=Ophiocordyceps camponoti-floridani TaxID=2030778 RepID=A0A8H4Q3X2_9HYPO|nr:Cytochrome b5 [Ophiocordyceps camponoti-floridani]